MDVSVIIVNYNTLGLTSDCIESIIAQTSTVEYEIILVDNASTDGSKEVFAQDKRIKYIYSTKIWGSAGRITSESGKLKVDICFS